MSHHTTIWVQSCSAETDADIWQTYQDSVRRHARKVVRVDLEVEFHGLSRTYPGIDYADSAVQLATHEVVRNAIRAEEEGYAAFAFVSTNDAGNREVKELTGIPAVFIAETAVYLAAQLATKFAFLTHNGGSRRKMESLTRERYGLGDRLVEGASINLTYKEFAAMYDDPAPWLTRFEEAARPVIARGASVLIPAGGPLNMFFVDHGFREVDGVPLIDIMAVLLKEAEKRVDLQALGMAQRGAPTVTTEQREALRGMFLG